MLQAHLGANPDWLAARGVAYGDVMAKGTAHDTLWAGCAMNIPSIAAGYGVSSAADQAELRRRIGDALSFQIENLPNEVDCLILSCADLYGEMSQPVSIQKLHDLLDPHFDEIVLVVYIRRQDDTILADYVEAVRSGRTTVSLDEYANTCMARDETVAPYLYYRQKLQKWLDVFGESSMVVRRYAQPDFIDGDIVSDLLGVVLGTWAPETDDLERVTMDHAPTSARMSAPGLAYLRRLSEALAADNVTPFELEASAPGQAETENMPAQQEAIRQNLLHFLRHVPFPIKPRPIMPAALSRKIMAQFAVSNEALRKRFAPDMEGPFFADRPDHPEHGNIETLSTDEAIAFSALILDHLAKAQD